MENYSPEVDWIRVDKLWHEATVSPSGEVIRRRYSKDNKYAYFDKTTMGQWVCCHFIKNTDVRLAVTLAGFEPINAAERLTVLLLN